MNREQEIQNIVDTVTAQVNSEPALPDGMKEEITKWIPKKDEIIDFESDRFGTTRVVTHDYEYDTYSLYRFFPIGNNWATSVDSKDGLAVDVMRKLLGLTRGL